MMRKVRKNSKLMVALICAMLCIMPLALNAQAESDVMTYGLLESAAKDGKLQQLESLGENLDAVVDHTVYGYAVKRFQTWFEVGDTELWSAVGIAPPSGTMTWEEWEQVSEAVAQYNQQNAEPIYLLAVQAQRFPRTCKLMENPSILAQWEKMQPLVGAADKDAARALLTEQVLTLNQAGHRAFVAGLVYDGQTYRLADMENRYAVVMKDADEAQKAKLAEEMKKVSFVETGILPEGTTYEAYGSAWNINQPMPSEDNFELWQQMEKDTVR